MTKVALFENDPFIITIKDADEVVEVFGEDYLSDFGVEVETELLQRYKTNYQEFKDIQKELRLIFESARS